MPDDVTTNPDSQSSTGAPIDPAAARDLVTKANNEAAKYRIERNEMREQLSAALAQVEALTGEKTTATERVSGVEKEFLKYRVAAKSGITLDNIDVFAARLQGDDEETLKADAASLLAAFGGATKPNQTATDPSQGHGDGAVTDGLSPGAAFLRTQLHGIN